jgi:hypothetical protein
MRFGRVIGIVLIAVMSAAVAAAQLTPPAPSGSGAPAVFFPEKTYEFPPVIDGTKVTHDFVVANQGTAPLMINEVRTG